MDGARNDRAEIVRSLLAPRIRERAKPGLVVGEKNVTYGPFVKEMHEQLRCVFVFSVRDGRDVVRSLVNWHDKKFGNIYRECKEPGELSPEALTAAANLPVDQDAADYFRPRPRADDPLSVEWERLTRAEMCAYYWSRINELYLDQLESLPEECWIRLDYTDPGPKDILRAACFLGLRGLHEEQVAELLAQRINSLKDRGVVEEGTYPDWRNWDGGMRRRFDRLAAGTMRRLGYYDPEGAEWRPGGFGDWWRAHDGGLEWYTWMYESRIEVHRAVFEWVRAKDCLEDPIDSIADFGCGLGVGYADEFASKRYIGVDLSEKNIRWCRENRKNERHEYHCLDFIAEPLDQPVDLVISGGTIDNSYDIDAFLTAMVRASRKWICATLYRGWFPDLVEHRYQWSEEHKCFYNDASPRRIRQTLTDLGCREINIYPILTGRSDIPFETWVSARVPERNE